MLSSLFNAVHSVFHAAQPKYELLFAVGDIHGYDDAAIRIHDKIDAYAASRPGKQVTVIHLADYGNKGPRTSQTYDRLCAFRARADGFKKIFLKGDHEIAMIDMLVRPHFSSAVQAFFDYGGIATLRSYDVKFRASGKMQRFENHRVKGTNDIITPDDFARMQEDFIVAVPDAHKEFLSDLKVSYETPRFFFSHAGIEKDRALHDQHEDVLTGFIATRENNRGISNEFMASQKMFNKIIVHAHTIETPKIRMGRIGLDSGIYRNGVLTAAALEDNKVRFLQAHTDLPLIGSQKPSELARRHG